MIRYYHLKYNHDKYDNNGKGWYTQLNVKMKEHGFPEHAYAIGDMASKHGHIVHTRILLNITLVSKFTL